jgi:hypothetical protein
MNNIKCCSKACIECGFTKDGTTNTLYADIHEIIKDIKVFPCHMYLKSKTGSENTGVEKLESIQVCRGYVSFMKINYPEIGLFSQAWNKLFDEIEPSELNNIRSIQELYSSHSGLRENKYLNN